MSKKPNKPVKLKAKGKAPAFSKSAHLGSLEHSNEADGISDSDHENGEEGSDGIDEAGMKKLMKALGDDGLDDIAQHMLESLNDEGGTEDELGENSDAESKMSKKQALAEAESNDGEGDEENDEEKNGEITEDEESVELDKLSSVDEDAIPRQKIIINNKVYS